MSISLVLSLGGIVVICCVFVHYKSAQYYSFFARRHVPFRKPWLIFGNLAGVLFRTQTFMQAIRSSYDFFKAESFYGIFHFYIPVLFVRDPDLIKRMLHEDFEHFIDHMHWTHDPRVEPLIGRSLYALNGQKWHAMRATLSPALSGARVRAMFQLVEACAQRSMDALRQEAAVAASGQQHAAGTEDVVCWQPNMKDVLSRFSHDVIASVAFGTEVNSIKHRTNRFYTMAMRALAVNSWSGICRVVLAAVTFKLGPRFRFRWFQADVIQHFNSTVLDTMKYRAEYNVERNDMIQMMMSAQNGYLEQMNDEEIDGRTTTDADAMEVGSEDMRGSKRRHWVDEELTAQCFMFFMTGYTTIFGTLGFLIYELVVNVAIQTKMIAEIDALRDNLNGRQLTYADLEHLKYVGMVIDETMRKWPSVMKAGDNVCFPMIGIHRDAEYFPDPERFDPERFSDERKHQIRPFTYLPFGSGPRNCLGEKLAVAELKIFVYYLLTAFTLERTAMTQVPVKLKKNGFTLEMEQDLEIRMNPRNL